jgi:hypothetical protein
MRLWGSTPADSRRGLAEHKADLGPLFENAGTPGRCFFASRLTKRFPLVAALFIHASSTLVTFPSVFSLLAALDEPRKIYYLLKAVDSGGSEEELQLILMQMVDHRSAHLSGLADRWN